MWDKIRASRNFQDSSGRLLSPKIFHRINKRWGNSSNTWIQSLSLDSSIHSMEAKSSEPSNRRFPTKLGHNGIPLCLSIFFKTGKVLLKAETERTLTILVTPNWSTLKLCYSQILELWAPCNLGTAKYWSCEKRNHYLYPNQTCWRIPGSVNRNPPKSKYLSIWDVEQVLTYIKRLSNNTGLLDRTLLLKQFCFFSLLQEGVMKSIVLRYAIW